MKLIDFTVKSDILKIKKQGKDFAMKKIVLLILALVLFPGGCSGKDIILPDTNSNTQSDFISNSESESPRVYDSDEVDEFGQPLFYVDPEYFTNFTLYTMIKSESIYLYGIDPHGIVIYYKGYGKYFDWDGPARGYSELAYADFDGDVKKDLAVIQMVGAGTGVCMMDLHILKIEKIDYDYGGHSYNFKEYSFLWEDIDKYFTKKITAKQSKDKKSFIVSFDGKEYIFDDEYLSPELDSFIVVAYGDVVTFDINDKNDIILSLGLGFQYENIPVPFYFADIKAKVNFDGKNFKLSDYEFMIYN